MSETEKPVFDLLWRPDRSKFKDRMGKYITQGLFLEFEYNPERALYTFKDEDFFYKGQWFPSIRRLYMEVADPTEYEIATTYFWGWEHWKQIVGNTELRHEILKWREELEVKLRSRAAKSMLLASATNGAAAKWVADGKWTPTKQGKPTKQRQALDRKVREAAESEAAEDAKRLGLKGVD